MQIMLDRIHKDSEANELALDAVEKEEKDVEFLQDLLAQEELTLMDLPMEMRERFQRYLRNGIAAVDPWWCSSSSSSSFSMDAAPLPVPLHLVLDRWATQRPLPPSIVVQSDSIRPRILNITYTYAFLYRFYQGDLESADLLADMQRHLPQLCLDIFLPSWTPQSSSSAEDTTAAADLHSQAELPSSTTSLTLPTPSPSRVAAWLRTEGHLQATWPHSLLYSDVERLFESVSNIRQMYYHLLQVVKRIKASLRINDDDDLTRSKQLWQSAVRRIQFLLAYLKYLEVADQWQCEQDECMHHWSLCQEQAP
jgi:hypothetical protein